MLGACGSDSLTLPSEGEAAHIAVWGAWAETDQQGRVVSQLAESLAVQVTDTRDRAVVGATVEFLFEDGSGSTATPTSATTGDSGIARTSIKLGPRVGVVTGQARVVVAEGQTPVQTQFSATALSQDAYGIAMFSGEPQEGPVSTTLPAPLVVQVTDGFGNPIPGITVNWSAEGGGSVSAASTLTDVEGKTSVQRTLGPTAGQQTTTASAQDLVGSPVVFHHTATAGNAARVTIVSGNNQQAAPGTQLRDELVVEVLDENNNPIVGRAVAWVVGTGGGSANPETSNTNGQGRASTRWTLGPNPGPNTLSAVVSGVGRADFTATTSKSGSSTSITSDTPDPSVTGQPVEVRVQVSGSGGGTPTGTVSVTGEGAAGTCTITLSNGTGACNLTLTEAGQKQITASYSGDTQFNGSDDTESHRVTGPPNLPPVATADAYSTNEDEPLSVPAPGVLANDADLDGGPLTAIKDSDPANGTLTLNSDGSFTYRPAPGFSGTDAFTYHASDGSGVSAPVTVTITVNPVNDAPVANNDQYTTAAGVGFHAPDETRPSLIQNDTDPEGSPLTTTAASGPSTAGGTFAVATDGSFDYTPPAGFVGPDSFAYTVNDNAGGSATGTASIEVQ
jgi:VCBS repeat-containing protein